ncbi:MULTISPECIES: glutathione S-transferase [Rhizobium]|uniref:Glutathione S-transferase n=1 Tax=Rhizobium favelukesii TaxID=348824 RepID=W6RTD5_9HYPH|nr:MULTISPECIES: glutathione S-transferase [Rhizobium]MCA0801704.1 glutathione S-transferase [Rhizobium sp. T1473]MCS0459592.1 glutathione S-transferase [Rhizobium favelukesii]UFS80914.1 glutathione S-transferase [Rhizobium sp. T136]CDM57556.1 glutathione S-transferase [Rhizobium favelukesii]
MKLYSHPLSGHSHRARLFLSLIGVDVDVVEVDLAAREHKSASFLALNPFGQLPVLEDGGVIISDSNAILVYLAKKYAPEGWLPEEPAAAAAVQRWLSVAAGEIAYGPCAARLVTLFGAKFDSEDVIARAHRILQLIDDRLVDREWIAANRSTIADVALYSYIARAPEGNVDRSAYRNVTAWLERIEALPGFQPFQKSPVGIVEAA